MVRKAVGQVSLVEALLPAAFGGNQRLERIRAQVDWPPIEALLQPMRRASTGRPAYPPLVQLKALLLQQWYRLSDRDLEEALADRLSFRRFCGLGLEDVVPDAMIGHETDHPISVGGAARRLRRDAFPLSHRLG
jgi:transposase